MEKLISVIVPVYNVEKYLNRCVDSIINQSYKNLEIILVNDGSTDNSLNICKEYEKRDDRIVVIDKKNGGVSSARNKGIDFSNGDFISFIDGDDCIDSVFYEVMVNNMLLYDVNVVQTQWTTFYNEPNFKYSNHCRLVNKKIEDFILKDNNLYCSVRYLFSKDVIKENRFDETIKMGEDQKFNFFVIRNICKIVQSDYTGYFYYHNEKSVSNGIVKNNHYGDLKFRKDLINFVTDKKLKKLAKAHLLKGYLGFFIKSLVYGYQCEENIVEKYGAIVRKNFFNYLILPNIGIKRKVLVFICLFGNRITKKIASKII